MTLFVNGDSNSIGAELFDQNKSWASLLSKKLAKVLETEIEIDPSPEFINNFD